MKRISACGQFSPFSKNISRGKKKHTFFLGPQPFSFDRSRFSSASVRKKAKDFLPGVGFFLFSITHSAVAKREENRKKTHTFSREYSSQEEEEEDMEELSFPSSSSPNASAPGGGGNGNGADEASQQQPQQQFPMPQQQQENNNFFNAMPHHQYFQQPYPQHFNHHHQMHYPSRFLHHQHHHHPFGMQTRGQFSPRARVGDWMCPNNCGLVFSSKTNCFRCGVLKPPGSVRLVTSYPLSSLFFRYVFFSLFFFGRCRRSTTTR